MALVTTLKARFESPAISGMATIDQIRIGVTNKILPVLYGNCDERSQRIAHSESVPGHVKDRQLRERIRVVPDRR